MDRQKQLEVVIRDGPDHRLVREREREGRNAVIQGLAVLSCWGSDGGSAKGDALPEVTRRRR